jgi:hypothetical protein
MFTTSEYISPEDLDMLCMVFNEVLEDCHTSRNSGEAEDIAARLLVIYQSGVRDPMRLKTLVLPSLRYG